MGFIAIKINNKDYKQRILNELEKNNGIITANYCKMNGIPSIYLKNMID